MASPGMRRARGFAARWDRTALVGGRSLARRDEPSPSSHGKHWIAITGKPLAGTAGAMAFQKGGNAVDAACAMLAATSTMFDVLSWGGETQALIFDPRTGKVVALNGYKIEIETKTSGPINAIFFDRAPGPMWVGSSDYGDDCGIGW